MIAHQQRRGVVLKVVIATGAHAAFGIYGDKSAAGKLGRLDMCRHTGQHLRHHGIDVGLVVAHASGDDAIKIVVVSNVDCVQVIAIRVAGQAFERRGGLDLLVINDTGGSGKADGDSRDTAGDSNVTWLHDGSSRSIDIGIIANDMQVTCRIPASGMACRALEQRNRNDAASERQNNKVCPIKAIVAQTGSADRWARSIFAVDHSERERVGAAQRTAK